MIKKYYLQFLQRQSKIGSIQRPIFLIILEKTIYQLLKQVQCQFTQSQQTFIRSILKKNQNFLEQFLKNKEKEKQKYSKIFHNAILQQYFIIVSDLIPIIMIQQYKKLVFEHNIFFTEIIPFRRLFTIKSILNLGVQSNLIDPYFKFISKITSELPRQSIIKYLFEKDQKQVSTISKIRFFYKYIQILQPETIIFWLKNISVLKKFIIIIGPEFFDWLFQFAIQNCKSHQYQHIFEGCLYILSQYFHRDQYQSFYQNLIKIENMNFKFKNYLKQFGFKNHLITKQTYQFFGDSQNNNIQNIKIQNIPIILIKKQYNNYHNLYTVMQKQTFLENILDWYMDFVYEKQNHFSLQLNNKFQELIKDKIQEQLKKLKSDQIENTNLQLYRKFVHFLQIYLKIKNQFASQKIQLFFSYLLQNFKKEYFSIPLRIEILKLLDKNNIYIEQIMTQTIWFIRSTSSKAIINSTQALEKISHYPLSQLNLVLTNILPLVFEDFQYLYQPYLRLSCLEDQYNRLIMLKFILKKIQNPLPIQIYLYLSIKYPQLKQLLLLPSTTLNYKKQGNKIIVDNKYGRLIYRVSIKSYVYDNTRIIIERYLKLRYNQEDLIITFDYI